MLFTPVTGVVLFAVFLSYRGSFESGSFDRGFVTVVLLNVFSLTPVSKHLLEDLCLGVNRSKGSEYPNIYSGSLYRH